MTEPPWSLARAPTPTCLPEDDEERSVSALDQGLRGDGGGRTEVDVASDGGGTDVEPVLVVRGELLAGAGLDDVDPDGDLELACVGAR